jgi:hypothetical protein
VAEWSKAHAWKACKRQRFEGSNPFLSAKVNLKPLFVVLDFFKKKSNKPSLVALFFLKKFNPAFSAGLRFSFGINVVHPFLYALTLISGVF